MADTRRSQPRRVGAINEGPQCAMRSLSAMSKDLASWPPMRSWWVPTRPCRARFSVHGVARQSWTLSASAWASRRQSRGAQALGSVLVSFTPVRGRSPATVGPRPCWSGHSRPVVDGTAQSSKACEGATLPWVQIPPPPPLTRHDTSTWWPRSACLGSFCRSLWPRNGRCARSGPRFLPQDHAVCGSSCLRRLMASAWRSQTGHVAPPSTTGPGHMERQPQAPLTATCSPRLLAAAEAPAHPSPAPIAERGRHVGGRRAKSRRFGRLSSAGSLRPWMCIMEVPCEPGVTSVGGVLPEGSPAGEELR
jgi:hypothetical protein